MSPSAVTGHGLDDIIQKQFAQSAAFFGQLLEVKREIAIENTRFHRLRTCRSAMLLACTQWKAGAQTQQSLTCRQANKVIGISGPLPHSRVMPPSGLGCAFCHAVHGTPLAVRYCQVASEPL